MMFKSFQILIFPLIFSTFSLSCMDRYHFKRPRNNMVEHCKTAIGIGCLAAAGYGLYKLCEWAFSKSDQQVLKESTDTLEHMNDSYAQIVAYFDKYLTIPFDSHTQHTVIHDVNETFLYSYAILILEQRYTIDQVTQTLASNLSSLNSAHKMVIDRIQELYRYNKYEYINALEDKERKLGKLNHALNFIHDYLTHHKQYFKLFDCEASMLQKYEQELGAFDVYEYNPAMLREALRVAVMSRAARERINYPYIHSIEKITADMGQLERSVHALAYNYYNRITAAKLLCKKLSAIHGVLVSDGTYHQEIRDYERVQLEKQRIEAEKAQAAAAQAQANALQQQAWHMAQQNQIAAQQLQATHQQNALIAANTFINAINPPPAPEVHVYL